MHVSLLPKSSEPRSGRDDDAARRRSQNGLGRVPGPAARREWAMILSEPGLMQWGKRVGREVRAPVFLGLRGPLGAGKSVFARAVARGAGVEGPVPSPTFNLLFRYPTGRGCDLVHMDLYRVEDAGELWELGWEEIGLRGEIVLVEWPERAGGLLPGDRWEVDLAAPEPGSHLREVRVTSFGLPPNLPGFPFGQLPEGTEGG